MVLPLNIQPKSTDMFYFVKKFYQFDETYYKTLYLKYNLWFNLKQNGRQSLIGGTVSNLNKPE